MIVDEIEEEEAFNQMITATAQMSVDIESKLQITKEQYSVWQKEIDNISVPKFVLVIITTIRSEITKLNYKGVAESELAPIIISDRRWKKIIRLLRTSALLNGRNSIDISDMTLIASCIWDEQEHIEHIDNIIQKSFTNHLISVWREQLSEIEDKIKELREIDCNSKDDGFVLYEEKYFNIKKVNNGRTFIPKELYESLSERIPKEVIMTMTDQTGDNFNLLAPPKSHTAPRITISKTAAGVKINGKEFRLECKSDFNQITDPYHNEWMQMVASKAEELHKNFKLFLSDTKSQFADNIFCFNYSPIISEMERFEILTRKTLRIFTQ